MIVFSELTSKEFWKEILNQIEFVEQGFETKGTVLIIYPDNDVDSLFFLVCLLIHKFNWSMGKSIAYFQSILRGVQFSESVLKFLAFFEQRISQKKNVVLSDCWVSSKLDRVVSNTYLNSLKGSAQPQELELDEDSEDEERRKKKTKRKKSGRNSKVGRGLTGDFAEVEAHQEATSQAQEQELGENAQVQAEKIDRDSEIEFEIELIFGERRFDIASN